MSDGSENISKEYIEIFGDDCTFIIDDFEKLTFHSGSSKKILFRGIQDKGHENQIKIFLNYCLKGKNNLIPFNEITNGMDAIFAILDSIKNNKVVHIK